MKLLIDDTKLNLLLEQKREWIGKRAVWESLASAVSFLVSVLLASYEAYGAAATVLKIGFSILGVVFLGLGIRDYVRNRKNCYSYEDLFTDICQLNELTHNHSIAAIQNTFDPFPNKFLLYYDHRWQCYLFPNYKENINNEAFMRSHLSNELKISPENISMRYLDSMIHEKFSVSHQERRFYMHRLYSVTIEYFPNEMRQADFVCDGRQYVWMSIEKMEQDSRIMEVNRDIVDFVKANCG